ncbi:MAG: A/G-specific adenine glycosylase [Candidatus Levyibacteriota bacterium]
MSTRTKVFQKKIWEFLGPQTKSRTASFAYKENRREFPWRETTDPYKILVSEVMLQQTQTSRVLPKYQLFFERFPTIESLAKASNEDVLRVWSGLGYNRRALYLKKIAGILAREHNNKLPLDPKILKTFPGIGQNTAGAIYVFSKNVPYVFIETNIRRVFIHEFFKNRYSILDKEILKLIEKTLDRKNPREWYYALMDYGALLAKTEVNPNRKSKHYIKQSRFKGSSRQVRGQILKILLVRKKVSMKELEEQFGNKEYFKKALGQLKKEGFIEINGKNPQTLKIRY